MNMLMFVGMEAAGALELWGRSEQHEMRKVGTTPKEMRDEIMATFYHCTSTDDKPQHSVCAKGSDSWCFYNRAVAPGVQPQSRKKMRVYFRLDSELDLVKTVYDRLTTDDLMSRCLQGLTQNRNEHLHSRIWKMCHKHRSVYKRSVDLATATATCNYNVGYLESNFTHLFGIQYTHAMDKYLKHKDSSMDAPIKRKMTKARVCKELKYAAGAF
ncbi:hypothetical protein Pmani_007885 [Petrolisthes manimaculis]|uniref:Uncharacterized protein n=1 Tax=Petrolisthes manimaculis TaxID=1843537 RepID=A0AAE1Q6K0_9EUCA|nr:hypothetical protein Pmani_007885 [Petrolisthes manimaculis]